jgi:hypothetical protein
MFDKISNLVSTAKKADSDFLARAEDFEKKLLEAIGDYKVYARANDVNLESIGPDDWRYGYLYFGGTALWVASRTTEDDLSDHLNGVPEEHQSYKSIQLSKSNVEWIKKLLTKKNCDRLVFEIEKSLTADIDGTQEVANEIEALHDSRITEVNKDASNALRELSSDNLNRLWVRARASIETDPDMSITESSSFLESLCRKMLDDRGLPLPNKKDMQNYLKELTKMSLMAPDSEARQDLKVVISSLKGVMQSIATLRTHHGSAHGSSEDDYKPTPEMARLANSTAATISTFLIHTHLKMLKQEKP